VYTIRVTGECTIRVTSKFTIRVTGKFTIRVTGKFTIRVTGKCTIRVMEDFVFVFIQPKFYDGAKVILFSKEFKKAIRLMPNGDVNCLGGHGMKGTQ